MKIMRSYGEYCAIAQSLDVLGERWTLLIVRELLIRGSCRYTDIQNGLPGIPTNLLAERLRGMEKAGIIYREAAPPPVATTLFHLTERGKELKPVLDSLGKWGRPLVTRPIGDDSFRSHWLKLPLEAHLKDTRPDQPPITVELRTGDEPMILQTVEGAVRVTPGHARNPDAVVTGTGSQVLGLLTGKLDLAEARRRGLQLEGAEAAVDRVALPPQAPSPAC